MPTAMDAISGVREENRNFVGTIAFRSESLKLPDGSKMALGIDDGRWVLIHETPLDKNIICYEYNSHDMKLLVDKRHGTGEELSRMNKLVSYFLENVDSEDLVTIFPPKAVK